LEAWAARRLPSPGMMQREHQRHERLVVVVTGGSAGIGRAIAQAFARRGARVAVLARGNDRLASTRGDIEQLGGEALVLPTDVADPQQVEAAADEVERRWGAIDAWINNAMATTFSPVADITADDVRRGRSPRCGVGHDGRAQTHEAARPRRDRSGRLGARLPVDPVAGTLLRREGSAAWLHRLAAQRADP
jgi:hypothetical protein